MKRYLTALVISIGLVVGVIGVVSPAPLHAYDPWGGCGSANKTTTTGANANADASGSATTPANTKDTGGSLQSGQSGQEICGAKGEALPDMMKKIINAILMILGIIAVIMIIIGGIRYTTSNGDSSAIKSAKDTIMYAVIGLVVAILAFAIVNFVIGAFK